MGKHYNHLTAHDRAIMELMLSEGIKKSRIATHLGVHVSTIYREIKRNQHYMPLLDEYRYFSWRAKEKYLLRRRRRKKLEIYPELLSFVQEKLRHQWSPWQIEWYLKRKECTLPTISHESIYRYLYSDWGARHNFTKYLRRRRYFQKKHNSRTQRKMDKHHISHRPENVDKREEFGHWECDLMVFKKPEKQNLITLVERQSRYTIAIKNESKHARLTAFSLLNALKAIKPHVNSITFDQGSEFSEFEYISRCLDADIYFCSPGSPHQKGAIENRNGVIRTVFPRNCDIKSVSQSEIDTAVSHINERPMRCLNFNSPTEIFNRAVSIYENR